MKNNCAYKKYLYLQHIWFIFHVFTATTGDGKSDPYVPETNVAIDCGSSGINMSLDQRSWTGDIYRLIWRARFRRNVWRSTANCMSENGAERPSMKEVLWGLETAMRLQNGNKAEDNHDSNGGDAVLLLADQIMDGSDDGALRPHCSWGDTSGVVFSQINDMHAR